MKARQGLWLFCLVVCIVVVAATTVLPSVNGETLYQNYSKQSVRVRTIWEQMLNIAVVNETVKSMLHLSIVALIGYLSLPLMSNWKKSIQNSKDNIINDTFEDIQGTLDTHRMKKEIVVTYEDHTVELTNQKTGEKIQMTSKLLVDTLDKVVFRPGGKHNEDRVDDETSLVSAKGRALVLYLILNRVFPSITKPTTEYKFWCALADGIVFNADQNPVIYDACSRLQLHAISCTTHRRTRDYVENCMNWVNPRSGKKYPLIGDETARYLLKHADKFDLWTNPERELDLRGFLGLKCLGKGYLISDSVNRFPLERVSQMYLRVAVGLYGNDKDEKGTLRSVQKCYNDLMNNYYTHASPTLFNSGTRIPQMSSCFLITLDSDSMEGITSGWVDMAAISKSGGGLSFMPAVRGKGAFIAGTNGTSQGLAPLLKVIDKIALYVDQAGKRKGAYAMIYKLWMKDIETFLNMKRITGDAAEKARDLFYALMVSDLFWERLRADGDWSLFCPSVTPELLNLYGEEFRAKYIECEKKGLAARKVKASQVLQWIINANIESGTPYIINVGHANRTCGQVKKRHLSPKMFDRLIKKWKKEGKQYLIDDLYLIISLTNLCAEILLPTIGKGEGPKGIDMDRLRYVFHKMQKYMDMDLEKLSKKQLKEIEKDLKMVFKEAQREDKKEIAVCNLATIIVPTYIKEVDGKKVIDYDLIVEKTRQLTRNMKQVIDRNWYPVEAARRGNQRRRPIGIGVQQLGTAIAMMGYEYDSKEGRLINARVHEAIYYGAMRENCQLAIEHGSYMYYEGSPAQVHGKLQFDLWEENVKFMQETWIPRVNAMIKNPAERINPKEFAWKPMLSGKWKWDEIRKMSMTTGHYFSEVTTGPPTATTKNIVAGRGASPSHEPIFSNSMTVRVLGGDIPVVDEAFIALAVKKGIYNRKTFNQICRDNGSVRNVKGLTDKEKRIFRTAFEVPIDSQQQMARDRGAFITMTQSFNLHIAHPTPAVLATVWMRGYLYGLLTNQYYLRSLRIAQQIVEDEDDDSKMSTVHKVDEIMADLKIAEEMKKEQTQRISANMKSKLPTQMKMAREILNRLLGAKLSDSGGMASPTLELKISCGDACE